MTIVGIGASAGGLNALKSLFAAMPADTGAAFVVVVHLSPEHKSHLAELIQPHCEMPVQQVTETVKLEPNRVYIIPPAANLNTIDTHLRLSDLEPHPHKRATVDHFFRTLADTHDGHSIGVVLTGTGSDGTLGLRYIKEAGGVTIAQDPSEAEYDGMPRSAVVAGVVDFVLPIQRIAEEVARLTRVEPRLRVPPDGEELNEDHSRLLHKIFAQIRSRTGHDFSQYKRSTVMRRIQRRMQLQHVESLERYLEFLRENRDEVRDLFDDLLITVTEFFRDQHVFECLEDKVIPALFEGKTSNDRIRVWSVGCSTGEEAYSIAILLLEELSKHEERPRLQVFASDLHERSLARAREGIYPLEISTNVRAEWLKRYFTKENDNYRVRREVREMVVFAPHNLLGDPPFSHLDLIVCRNVMIYLQRDVQRDVIRLFHYALDPEGRLVLGTSETVDRSELFTVEDKQSCVYRRRNVPTREVDLPILSVPQRTRHGEGNRDEDAPRRGAAESYGVLHERVVERYAPPSVLINADHEIVHSSTRAGRYMEIPGGEPTRQVFKLLREPLGVEVRAALAAARRSGESTRSQPVRVKFNGESRRVVVHIHPARDAELEGFTLVVFDELPEPISGADESNAKHPSQAADATTRREMEAEVELYRQRLQATIEEYESSREEMQASNEELQSANEELRSTMEELETSKEELQSMNEELATVSQENRHRVDELSQLSHDLQNLLASTDIATLFLDRELRIVRFTPQTEKLFNIRHTDRGRPLTDLTHHLEYPDIQADARRVLDRLERVEQEMPGNNGRWYLTRLVPYRTGDDRIDGVVVTFIDITERKRAEGETAKSKKYAESIVETLHEPLLVLNPDLTIKSVNAAFYEHFDVERDHTIGRKIYDLGNGQWNIPELRTLLEDVLPESNVFNDYLVSHDFETIGKRVMLLNARRLDHVQLILLGIRDITERHQFEAALRDADRRKDEFLATLAHELRNPLATIRSGIDVVKLAPEDTQLIRETCGLIERQLAHLVALVDDLLEVSRISRGKLKLRNEVVVLGDAISSAIDSCRTLIREAGHELIVDLSAQAMHVEGDPFRLTQLFANLITNAVKYTPSGGRIEVSARREDDNAVIAISDSGIGLAEEQLERIFEMFAQVEPESAGNIGLGIGLALVKSLVELHGGEITAASAGTGSGATFTIRLPTTTREPVPGSKPTVGSAAPDAVGKRVLVVDDNASAAKLLAIVIQRMGHHVMTASNGQQAVELGREFRPEIVIMDLGMPIMDGYQAARTIRSEPWGQDIQLVALTGWGQDDDRQNTHEAGFNRHLVKPVAPDTIRSLISELTASHDQNH